MDPSRLFFKLDLVWILVTIKMAIKTSLQDDNLLFYGLFVIYLLVIIIPCMKKNFGAYYNNNNNQFTSLTKKSKDGNIT
jgi:hypothetical protein